MWWIFQEAEQLFSILPPPPQIMLIPGRFRELLCKGETPPALQAASLPLSSTQMSDPGGK